MEVLAAAVGALVAEPCRVLFTSINAKIRSFFGFQSVFNDLDKETNDLMERKASVDQQLEAAKRMGQVAITEVTDWQRKVEKFEDEVNEIKSGMQKINDNCIHGCYFNCCNREKLLSDAIEKREEAKRLIQGSSFPAGVATASQVPETVEYFPVTFIEDQSTAAKTTEEIMKLLCNDGVKRIGIWGMGGVGKTTIVTNVNNKLKEASSIARAFSIVIWLTVSNKSEESEESVLVRVQKDIAKRLMMTIEEDYVRRRASQLHKRLEKEKFLLILDDVWHPINLHAVGIPQPETHEGCKILLTTRSLEVFGAMMIDTPNILKVEVLNEEEAWQLFSRHAGYVVTLEHVEPLAKEITRECGGLPLAIMVVGASMMGKEMVELWKDALHALRTSQPLITGIQDKVYKLLKFSYDALPDERTKACFLFCCLFPEDHKMKVDDLVWYWFAEGLLDEHENFEETRNRGITIIEFLKDSCLLEPYVEATVKMHDVVRDVSVWISKEKQEYRTIVKSGLGLKMLRDEFFLNSARRLSFMFNEIGALPNSVNSCPLATTLLLQGNRRLGKISDTFLQAFPSLRVFDLRDCCIRSLPLSLNQLVELRALILAGYDHLEEIPPVGGLRKLQLLDCSGTAIKTLPEGMENLTSLRKLDLSYIKSSVTIRTGAIAGLSNLEILDMSRGTGEWHMKGKAGEGTSALEEILLLERLTCWHMNSDSISWSVTPSDVLIQQTKKIKNCNITIGTCSRSIERSDVNSERPVILNDLLLSGEWIGWLFIIATSVYLYGCEGLNEMFEKLAMNSTAIGSFDSLRTLDIASSQSSFQLRATCSVQFDLLPNLEYLYLRDLTQLTSISPLADHLGLKFPSLRCIIIDRCPRLKYLLSVGTFVPQLGSLHEIRVDSCAELEELFRYDSTGSSQLLAPASVFLNLQIMRLNNLPKLQNFCRESIGLPSIKKLEVTNCPLLRRLPVTRRSGSTANEIQAEP